MSAHTQQILDQIDAAIDDWEVGPDAMRCGAPAGTTPTRPGRMPRSTIPHLSERMAPFAPLVLSTDHQRRLAEVLKLVGTDIDALIANATTSREHE